MLRWFTWIRSVTQILDWLQILAYHLVQSVGHEAVKASLLRLQVIRSELLDEHASWGHSDLRVGEKRGSVWSDNGHFTCGQRWHYAVHMARTSAVVCVGRCAFRCSYHPGVAAPLQEWNHSLGEDVHAWERRGELTCFSSMMRFDGRQATSKLLLSYHSRSQVDQACLSMIAVI